MDSRLWVAWDASGDRALGLGNTSVMAGEANRHILYLSIRVRPDARRRGIATRLLKHAAEAARRKDRRLFLATTISRVPAGEAFMNRLGASMGLSNSSSELLIDDLDPSLMRRWRERAHERASDFALGLWEGPYPDDAIADVLAMYKVMNTAPRGELDIEDLEPTVELLREWEANTRETGVERWTMFARHVATGKIAGYTEVFWHPSRPDLLGQGDTGVSPEFRNRGLGRWLKAAMMEKVLSDRPQVTRVRTGNAESNAPMLAINREIGFKHVLTTYDWQVDVDRVVEYLASGRRRDGPTRLSARGRPGRSAIGTARLSGGSRFGRRPRLRRGPRSPTGRSGGRRAESGVRRPRSTRSACGGGLGRPVDSLCRP
jgi:GNAT superfamily N-acetyltransferase